MANRIINALRSLTARESAPIPYVRTPPRGITVYTGMTAEHYAAADDWKIDDKETLYVFDRRGLGVATFIHGTWGRVEVGIPAENPPDQPSAVHE